jgi:hypothetical protein
MTLFITFFFENCEKPFDIDYSDSFEIVCVENYAKHLIIFVCF